MEVNGLHPLAANKSWCFSVRGDVLSQATLPLWPKEERDVPTWSCSHPLLIEHLSLLVMDVRRSCSCMSTNGGDTREMERSRHNAALSVKR